MHNAGMIYGYARVSTDAQDLTSQLAQLKAAGCEKVFREKITGTTADRAQLQKLMKALASGDVVITPAVDRLSRDVTDLLVIARDMHRAGAGLRSIAEPVVDTTSDAADRCRTRARFVHQGPSGACCVRSHIVRTGTWGRKCSIGVEGKHILRDRLHLFDCGRDADNQVHDRNREHWTQEDAPLPSADTANTGCGSV